MPTCDKRRICAVPLLAVVAAVALGAGCANAPSTGGSGVRLVVTMRFNAPVRDSYHYFLVIRNASDDVGQNAPIPVILPPYGGNGFATDRNPASPTAAFTDFVQYNRTDQPLVTNTGYTVYHVPGGVFGDPSRNFYTARGNPVATVQPNGTNVLQFELDLSQIAPAEGETAPNPDDRPRYLQVNIIATTTTPVNAVNPDPLYVVDAIGDQTNAAGSESFNSFITIDTSQIGKVYSSAISPGPEEPTGDPWPDDRDPAIDLTFWSIQVTGRE